MLERSKLEADCFLVECSMQNGESGCSQSSYATVRIHRSASPYPESNPESIVLHSGSIVG